MGLASPPKTWYATAMLLMLLHSTTSGGPRGADALSSYNCSPSPSLPWRAAPSLPRSAVRMAASGKELGGGADPEVDRRRWLGGVARTASLVGGAAACSTGCCSPRAAYGLATIALPAPEAAAAYDVARNQVQDAMFAQGMAIGMVDYEREAAPAKKRLFGRLFSSLEDLAEPTVVEVGMGSFPNALYYKGRKGVDIVGVDPNDRMEMYARDSAARAGLVPADSLRIVHGVSEALPLEDNSVDAVVCTLTLCSVLDPERSVAEMRRVLKPGGRLLFWEHVLSQTNPALARRQIELTPAQVRRADGCHLDRRTGEVIHAAGFKKLDMEYLELKNFALLNPTVCGIAYK